MTNIIAFRPPSDRKKIEKPDTTGQILLFTGVRYMRETDAAAAAAEALAVTTTLVSGTERLQA